MKKTLLVVSAAVSIILISILVLNLDSHQPLVTTNGITLDSDDIKQITTRSKDILRDIPTFRFDGIDSSIKTRYVDATEKKIRVDLEFTSENIGYGVRDSVPLMKHPTAHSVRIYLETEKYDTISVDVDGCWDALNQEWDKKSQRCSKIPYYITPPNYVVNYGYSSGPLYSHFSGMGVFKEFEKIYGVEKGDFDAEFPFVNNFHDSDNAENWGYFQFKSESNDETTLLIARIHQDMTVSEMQFLHTKDPSLIIDVKEDDIVYYTIEDVHAQKSVYSNPDIFVLKTEKEIMDYLRGNT